MEKVFTVKHVWKRYDRNQVILENRNDKIKEMEVYASEIQTTVDHVIFNPIRPGGAYVPRLIFGGPPEKSAVNFSL